MSEKSQNGMECSRFEGLLAEALDGALPEDISRAFHAHAETCMSCGPLFSEAQEGMRLLDVIEDVEPPANLVHNILAATSALQTAQPTVSHAGRQGWFERRWKPIWAGLSSMVQPRFATSFSMAFFSLSLTLTLAGVRLKDLARIDWRPSAVGKAAVLQYTQIESRVVRYYDNMRLVYEIESRVGELRRASGVEEKREPEHIKPEKPKPEKKRDQNDTSGRPEQRQDYYSRERGHAVMDRLEKSNEGA